MCCLLIIYSLTVYDSYAMSYLKKLLIYVLKILSF